MGRDLLNESWKEASGKCFKCWIQREKKRKRMSWYFSIIDCVLEKKIMDNACLVCEAVWKDTEATGFKDEIPKLDFITFNSSPTLTYATSRNYLLEKPQLMC